MQDFIRDFITRIVEDVRNNDLSDNNLINKYTTEWNALIKESIDELLLNAKRRKGEKIMKWKWFCKILIHKYKHPKHKDCSCNKGDTNWGVRICERCGEEQHLMYHKFGNRRTSWKTISRLEI